MFGSYQPKGANHRRAPLRLQGNIVAELTSVENQNLVALVGSKEVHTVVSHDIIG